MGEVPGGSSENELLFPFCIFSLGRLVGNKKKISLISLRHAGCQNQRQAGCLRWPLLELAGLVTFYLFLISFLFF